MNKLPTLYSRTTTGAIQEWTIEIDGGQYRTIHGQTDGKKTTTKWTIAEATNVGRANERDIKAQALFEAQAVWQHKAERGYFADVADIDNPYFIEPMLAQKYEDRKDEIAFPVYCQPKLDGIRCICTKDGMFSRQGKRFASAPHISAYLKDFFKKNPKVILDGELYADKFANDFNKICSLVKKQKPSAADLLLSAAQIQYHVYDMVDTTKVFSKRIEWLMNSLPHTDTQLIVLVSTRKVDTQAILDEYYGTWREAGYEGQMVRVDSCYEQKRSKNLLKRKEFQDAEYRIVGIGEGAGNRSSMAGYAIMENKDGSNFRSNIKGTHEFLTELWKNRSSEEVMGAYATVQFFNLTPDGVPRFPYIVAIRNYE